MANNTILSKAPFAKEDRKETFMTSFPFKKGIATFSAGAGHKQIQIISTKLQSSSGKNK